MSANPDPNEREGNTMTTKTVNDLRTARARGERPSAPNADLRGANLGGANLSNANLSNANLRGADLRGADLRGASLWGANLRDADLSNANLRVADLSNADLWGADLSNANLSNANLWGGLRIDGLPSGAVTMVPLRSGWHLRVGCWTGTIDDLATLVAQDKGWPEARGAEIIRRRPGLLAVIYLCRAHADLHADKLAAVVEKWTPKGEVTA